MLFGTDHTFLLISDILKQNEVKAYEPLCVILYDDSRMLIKKYCKGIQPADIEDLQQEIVWHVLRDLPRFYDQSFGKTETERNAYLKRIAYNVCMDFFRKAKRSVLTNAIDIDDPSIHASGEDFTRRVNDRESFLSALRGAFCIKTTPDKLLAFVYNRLISALSGTNGSPKSIIAEFEGVFLRDMYERMVSDLSNILCIEIPAEVLMPLKEKVYGEFYASIFHMSAHQIADSSNWIVDKVKEQNTK